jgi:hypothetical protein
MSLSSLSAPDSPRPCRGSRISPIAIEDRYRFQHACPGLDGHQHLPGPEPDLELARLRFWDAEAG